MRASTIARVLYLAHGIIKGCRPVGEKLCTKYAGRPRGTSSSSASTEDEEEEFLSMRFHPPNSTPFLCKLPLYVFESHRLISVSLFLGKMNYFFHLSIHFGNNSACCENYKFCYPFHVKMPTFNYSNMVIVYKKKTMQNFFMIRKNLCTNFNFDIQLNKGYSIIRF